MNIPPYPIVISEYGTPPPAFDKWDGRNKKGVIGLFQQLKSIVLNIYFVFTYCPDNTPSSKFRPFTVTYSD